MWNFIKCFLEIQIDYIYRVPIINPFSYVHNKTTHLLRGAGVAEWARVLTGDRTVNGSSPAAVNIFRFASELWQFRLPRLASVFRMRH